MITVSQLKPQQMYQTRTRPDGSTYILVVPQPFLYCPRCGGEYSANASDYWAAVPDTPLTCSNGHRRAAMRLVERRTELVEVARHEQA